MSLQLLEKCGVDCAVWCWSFIDDLSELYGSLSGRVLFIVPFVVGWQTNYGWSYRYFIARQRKLERTLNLLRWMVLRVCMKAENLTGCL
jgi:hypothetical protein